MSQPYNANEVSTNDWLAEENISTLTDNRSRVRNRGRKPDEDFPVEVIIIAYTTIFCVSVLGNIAVIITLTKVRSMRTVTNVLLLNLSVADLLVSICCMPPTLTSVVMQDYIFGDILCRIVPFLQGLAVCVSAFTLTVLSLERYFAVCRPLRSRRWQTLSHAYRCICVSWFVAAMSVIPPTFVNRIIPLNNGSRKCFEAWGRSRRQKTMRRAYCIFLDIILLVGPLLVMTLAYSLVIRVLHKKTSDSSLSSAFSQDVSSQNSRQDRFTTACKQHQRNVLVLKRKTVTMLIVIVVEFFICHTPQLVLQTWEAFDRDHAWATVSSKQASIVTLLTYVSNGCNPITYCFLSERFRQAFAETFLGRRQIQRTEYNPSRGSYSVITFRKTPPARNQSPVSTTNTKIKNGCLLSASERADAVQREGQNTSSLSEEQE